MKDFVVSIGYKFSGADDLGMANDEAQRIGLIMARAIDLALSEAKIESEELTTSYHHLEEAHMDLNAKRCDKCEEWATDWGKPRSIDALTPGWENEGNWFCDMCGHDDEPIAE